MTAPILVLQHSRHEGPAALGRHFDARGIGWELRRLDLGEPVPDGPGDWAGVVLMGGIMSAYDDSVAFVPAELRFIEALLAAQRPVLGICLGAQLLARASGARVARMPAREIGWHPVTAVAPLAADLLGEALAADTPPVFQWHGDAFERPARAEPLFTGAVCPVQGFVIGGNTLAVQFHPEVDIPVLEQWVQDEYDWMRRHGGQPHVQTMEELLARAPEGLAAMRPLSEALYEAWLRGVEV
jgi:GMP synthase (glutamine-hydrolysing)